jgi:hypothetical protein
MNKNAFKLFVTCSVIIIGIGLILELRGTKIFFYKDEGFKDYQFIHGWEVMLLGGIMLVFGYFVKWKMKKNNRITERTSVRLCLRVAASAKQGATKVK